MKRDVKPHPDAIPALDDQGLCAGREAERSQAAAVGSNSNRRVIRICAGHRTLRRGEQNLRTISKRTLASSEIVKEVAAQKAKHSLASARPPDTTGLHDVGYHLWSRAKEAASSDNSGDEWIPID